MPLNVTYPTSVNVGFLISLGWSNTYGDSYFTVNKQVNYNSAWLGTIFPIGSNLTRYSEEAESTWTRVRYRISGFPSGTIVTTDWIAIIGGVDPGGPGDPDPGDPLPDPSPSVPVIFTPSSLTPGVNFTLNWNDSNGTTATYDIEESVNNGDYQRIATSWPHKSYDRFIPTSWNTVQYMVRAKRNNQTSLWGYSGLITVETIFSPKMSVKVGDTLRTAKDGWVKVNGQLRRITDIWTKVNGQLKKS